MSCLLALIPLLLTLGERTAPSSSTVDVAAPPAAFDIALPVAVDSSGDCLEGDAWTAPDETPLADASSDKCESSAQVRDDAGEPACAFVAAPNLKVVSISHVAYTYPNNTCSVRFYVRVFNAGSGAAGSFNVGAKGWGTPTIPTCTGTWRAINTTTPLGAGQYRTVLVYGPGYVGPPILKGSHLNVTCGADTHCAVAESSESDNTKTTGFNIGL